MGIFTLDYGNHGPALADAFAAAYHYQDEVEDPDNPGEMIPNPESRGNFAKRMLVNHIIGILQDWDPDVLTAQIAKADALAAARTKYSNITLE